MKHPLIIMRIPRNASTGLGQFAQRNNIPALHHNIRKPYTFLYEYEFERAFALIRDPWSRVISARAWLFAGGNCKADAADYHTYCVDDFDEFVRHHLEHAAQRQIHFLPQHYWITDPAGRIVATDLYALEDIQVGLDWIAEEYGLQKMTAPVLNTSDHLSSRELYTHETDAIVRRIYGRDADLYEQCRARLR